MPERHPGDPPSPFIDAWIAKLARESGEQRRALDVAAGRGRHAIRLAAAGFRTFAVDVNDEAARDLRARSRSLGCDVAVWCADLTQVTLPSAHFDLIVVARYLQRDLCPTLIETLTPGGFLLYETFTERQRGRGRGPQSPDHLLRLGELRRLFSGLVEVFYEELSDPSEDAVARLAARKRSSPS
jgi:tellurite methyltransferase